MEELTKEQFDEIFNQRINISPCKRCGMSPEIVIFYPWYGATGAKLICPKCGAETKLQGITHMMLCEDGRIWTPATNYSMMRGIENAIRVWETTLGERKEQK